GGGLMWLVGKNPPPDLPEPPDLAEAAFPDMAGAFDTEEPQSSYRDATTYNNFYEFGTGKDDPARNAHTLQPRPWTVAIEGEVSKPQSYDVDTLIGLFPLQQRVYPMRCVEGWSMVIPWVGFRLGDLIKRVEPTRNAKYVEFT